MRSYLIIIGFNTHDKYEIISSYYFIQFGLSLLYPYVVPKYHFCPHLALFTYIFTLIYLYLTPTPHGPKIDSGCSV